MEIALTMVEGSSGFSIDTEIDGCDMRGSADIYTQMLIAMTIFGWAQAREQSGIVLNV